MWFRDDTRLRWYPRPRGGVPAVSEDWTDRGREVTYILPRTLFHFLVSWGKNEFIHVKALENLKLHTECNYLGKTLHRLLKKSTFAFQECSGVHEPGHFPRRSRWRKPWGITAPIEGRCTFKERHLSRASQVEAQFVKSSGLARFRIGRMP